MASTKHIREQEQSRLKSQRTTHILNVSYLLFLEKGVAAVEMKDIADIAQISRATLYRYFPSKQALAFGILEYIAREQIIPKYKTARSTFAGTGYEKFSQFVNQLVNAYYLFPDFFRYTAMIQSYYGHQLEAKEQATWYRDLYAGLYVKNTPRKFLEEGQRDGSIRKDIDPHLYLATVLATIPILAEHIAINPDFARVLYDVSNPDLLVEIASKALVRALLPADPE